MAEVSGGRVRERPRLGWMDGVRVALGKSGEPWYICNLMSFTRQFLIGPVFFRTALPCSGGYHMESRGMPLHDVVRINCKKRATTENQGSAVKYMGKGVYLDDCVCVLSDLT